ncbi:MAG TPA: hypothetical protein VMT62_02445 [Syntrophorhabdaceae bacterium]|nr:hypothetical protein [Syntrophorhabdaceae bacterium]
MEEKRLVERFNDVFVKTVPIFEDIKKGFFALKLDMLKRSKREFRDLLKSRVGYVQDIIEQKEKSAAQKEYLLLLPMFQTMALAIENLMNKMETKVELSILFSEKALAEIEEIFSIVEEQFRDTRDYVITGNPRLKANIKASWEKIFKLTDEYAVIHQNRLIIGVCMPTASYLYLDIIDSIKRIARGLSEFSEKV